MVEMESNRMPVVPAELAAPASLGNEYLLDLAPPPDHGLGPAPLAPRPQISTDECELGFAVLPAATGNAAESIRPGPLELLRRYGRPSAPSSGPGEAVLLEASPDGGDRTVEGIRNVLKGCTALYQRLEPLARYRAAR